MLAPPAAKPATDLPPQAMQYVKPRRFPKQRFSLRPRSCQVQSSFSPSRQRTLRQSRSLGSSQLPCARDFQAGMLAGAAESVRIYDDTLHPRRGGSPSEEPGTLRFCDARLLHIDKTHALSNREGGVSTPHPQGAPCVIHAWRHSSCGSFPNSAPASTARPAAVADTLIPAVARSIT